jgi:predicted Zn-dependent protease
MRSLLILILLLASASPRAETPVTGRAQTMLFSRAQIQAVAETAYSDKLVQLANQGELDTDRVILARVRNAGAHLIAQAIRLKPAAADWPWEIHVTSDENVAAYAMAGGKLLVGSRFITANHFTDGELTVLLAHEVAHVIAEHIREQVSVAATFIPPSPNRHVQLQDVINDMDSNIVVSLRLQPLSRLQELEADDIGIELAARAGTPPKSIHAFYRKLANGDGGQSLFDTHGSPRQRAEFVHNMLGYAGIEYKEYRTQQQAAYIFR